MKMIIVIPARLASFRLSQKPLRVAGGKSLIQWTYEQALQASSLVVVTSNDREICRHCDEVNIPWRPSREDHPNGTSRVEEVIRQMAPGSVTNGDIVVNWQVDEPLVQPHYVRRFGAAGSTIQTLVGPLAEKENPHTVKAIVLQQECRWFSRAPMAGAMGHCGIYAFPYHLLTRLVAEGPGPYSKAEDLEQLAWMESVNARPVMAIEMKTLPLAINTREDWTRFQLLKEGGTQNEDS